MKWTHYHGYMSWICDQLLEAPYAYEHNDNTSHLNTFKKLTRLHSLTTLALQTAKPLWKLRGINISGRSLDYSVKFWKQRESDNLFFSAQTKKLTLHRYSTPHSRHYRHYLQPKLTLEKLWRCFQNFAELAENSVSFSPIERDRSVCQLEIDTGGERKKKFMGGVWGV